MTVSIDKAILATADRGPVLAVLTSFGRKAVDDWLAHNHPAKGGYLPRRWQEVCKLQPSELIEATAAAAPNHCIDGWAYVSRALSALLAGDLHAARHLAYYAQLRAGLSMLGHLGVGIFNGINFAIQSSGTVVKLDTTPRGGLGTHSAVWAALENWVSDPGMARQFLDLVRIGNATLSDCLDAIWPGASKTAIAGSLVAAWGIDLKRGEDEHVARNMSSYNPQAFEELPDDPRDRVAFVENVWALFQPTSSNKFDLLDRSLLRALLWQQHDLLGLGDRSGGPIARRFPHLPENIKRIAPLPFLTGRADPHEPKVLKLARSKRKPALATHMIARALLLLRAATAFTVANFQDAGVSVENGDLRPWIDKIAVGRGYWGIAAPLDDPSDLWEDVRLALEQVSKSKMPQITCLNDWMQRTPIGLPTISEAERIGVWSFGS
jgi:hypothetical protein